MLDGSGSITFDVLTWLNEQKVPLIKIDWTGNVAMIASGDSFAANRHRVAWQTENSLGSSEADAVLQCTDHQEDRRLHSDT